MPGGHGKSAQPFQRALPNTHQPGHMRIGGQPAVGFRIGRVVQDINDVRSADAGRVVNAGVLIGRLLMKLTDPVLGLTASCRPCCRSADSRWDTP